MTPSFFGTIFGHGWRNIMRHFTLGTLVLSWFFLLACNNNPTNQASQKKLDSLTSENKQLKAQLNTSDTTIEQTESEETVSNATPTKNSSAGTHPISLQWIGWDNPGSATVTPIDKEWYRIDGSQKNNEGDYLTIAGKIKRVNKKELYFEGKIVTKVSINNAGEPCVKEGPQRFYGKGNRTYFRLQNMENCEGGMLVDYVDIYPGSSGL